MKKSKILVPALGILVLSTAASITGTVAWFSVNNSVKVDGMYVKTQVSGNLQIAKTNEEAKFGSALTMGTNPSLLEPTSTIDALNYFYTTDAKADGSKEHAATDTGYAYKEYSAENLTTFNEDYKTTDAVGYIDYAFFLKAVNPTAGETDAIRMTKCNLLYNGAAITEKAWRAAVFSQSTTKGGSPAAIASGDLISILTPDSAAYFNDTAVNSTTTKAAVSAKKGADAVVLQNITNANAFYCKITVRVWLEGEDTTCNNETYAKLTDNWSLDLEFQLVNPSATPAPAAAVNKIGSVGA